MSTVRSSEDPIDLQDLSRRGGRGRPAGSVKLRRRGAGQHIATLMIVVLPFSEYLDVQFVHNRFLTTTRILYIAGLAYFGLRLRRVSLDRRTVRIVTPPAVILFLYLVASAARGQHFDSGLGTATDVTILPVFLFVQIWRTGLVERVSSSLGWAASFVLAFEVYAAITEFVTKQYFFTYPGRESVLAYGYFGSQAVGVRATGTFRYPEELALVCGLLGLFLLRYWRERQRPLLGLGCVVLALTAGALSGLRGILIPLVLLMTWSYLRQGRHFFRRFAGMSAALFAILLVADRVFNPLHNPVIQERLNDSNNVYARIAAFKSAIAIFLDHPVIGVGYGEFTRVALDPQYYAQFRGVSFVPYPHNTFLSMLAEGGLLGLALYLWLWIAILDTPRHGVDRRVSRSAREMVFLFLLAGLSLNLGTEPVSVGATLILAGAATSLIRNRRPRNDLLRFGRVNRWASGWKMYTAQKSGLSADE